MNRAAIQRDLEVLREINRKRARLSKKLANVVVDDFGCHIWQGGVVESTGKGCVSFDGSHPVHRFFYIHLVGPIPDGAIVYQRCYVKLCVRPEHLFAGTRAEILADQIAERRRLQFGPRNRRGSPKFEDPRLAFLRRQVDELTQTIEGLQVKLRRAEATESELSISVDSR